MSTRTQRLIYQARRSPMLVTHTTADRVAQSLGVWIDRWKATQEYYAGDVALVRIRINRPAGYVPLRNGCWVMSDSVDPCSTEPPHVIEYLWLVCRRNRLYQFLADNPNCSLTARCW